MNATSKEIEKLTNECVARGTQHEIADISTIPEWVLQSNNVFKIEYSFDKGTKNHDFFTIKVKAIMSIEKLGNEWYFNSGIYILK